MTQKLTPEHERSASSVPPTSVGGEVVGLEGDRARVRLDTGVIGFTEIPPASKNQSQLQVGCKGRFKTIESDVDGEMQLSMLSFEDTSAPATFEHEVDRLQSALTQHHSTPIEHTEVVPTLDEQRIQQWLKRTDKSLERLRRNRAKRLDEEFYSGS